MNTEEPDKENTAGTNCSCAELLQIVVDGQANEEQVLYFRQHMENCPGCSSSYRIDTTLRTMVRTRCCGDQPPSDLAEKIKDQIRRIS